MQTEEACKIVSASWYPSRNPAAARSWEYPLSLRRSALEEGGHLADMRVFSFEETQEVVELGEVKKKTK